MGTRENILLAADQMFGEIGYDATSTREIAEACGVNKALIHYHFKNKEGLLATVLDEYYTKLTDRIGTALATEGGFRHKVIALVSTYSDFLAENQSFCRIVQREASGGTHASLIKDRMTPLFALGKAMVEQEYPHAADAGLAAEHLLVSVYGMIVTWFTYGDVLDPLLGQPANTQELQQQRKKHLAVVLEILFSALHNIEVHHAQ